MSESPPVPQTRTRRRWILASGLGLVALLAAALVWLLASHGGTVALARLAAGLTDGRLQIEVTEGRLLGPLRLGRLQYSDATTAIAVRDLYLDWTPSALRRRKLEIASLTAASIEVASAPSTEAPRVPQTLRLPLTVSVKHIGIALLKLAERQGNGDQPATEITRIEGRFDSDGRVHRLGDLRLNTQFGAVEGAASIGTDQPFPLQAKAHLAGSRDGKDYVVHATVDGPLERFSISAEADAMNVQAQVSVDATPFRAVPVARVQARATQIDPAVFHSAAPHASLTANVDLHSVAAKELTLDGTIDVTNGTPGPADRERLPLRALKAHVAWTESLLTLDDILLLFPGKGSAAGRATWEKETLKAQLKLQQLDLREIASVLKPTQLGGELDATATPSEQSLQADLRDPRFSVRLAASHRGNTVEIETARLEAKGAGVDASGKIALDERQGFDLRARLSRFDPSLFADIPRAQINAEFTARGEVKPQPTAEVAFSLRESRFDNKPLTGEGRVKLLADRLAQADITLNLAGNRVRANGAFGRRGDQLSIAIDAPRLAALGHGLAGAIKGEAVLIGTLAQPAGRIDLAGDKLALPGKQQLTHLSVKGELRDGVDGRFSLRAQLLQYRASERTLAQKVELSADGTRHDHVLKANGRLEGDRDFIVEAAGAMQAGPAWKGTLRTLSLTGKPPLRLLAPVTLEAAATRVALGAADLRSDVALIQIKELVWTPRTLVTRGQVRGIPVSVGSDPEEKAMLVSEDLTLGGEWQIRLGDHADGMVRLSRESGDLVLGGEQPVAAGLSVLEARVTALNDRLGWSLEAAGSRLGQISGAGTALAERSGSSWHLAPNAPVTGAVRASMQSIQWLGSLIDPDLRLDGALHAQIAITGTGAQPRGQGTIRGEKLTAASVEHGTRLSDGDLRVTFDEERVRLEVLTFASINRVKPRERRIDFAALTDRPGRLSASGDLELASGRGHLRVDAERLALAQRPDRWLILSGGGALDSAGAEGLRLTGKLKIDGGYFELTKDPPPSLSDDVVVKGRESAGRQHPVPLSMDVIVNMGRSFYFRGRGLDSRLAGEVRVRKDGHGSLRASGSIATRGGSFDAYGQELSIERGIVNFQGPLDNPGLNVLALRKNLPVEAGVSVTGPVNKPQVKLVSEPDVPDSEKLSWIVLGRGPDQSGGADSALLLSAANSILGGQPGGVTRQLVQSLGFDEIGIGSGQLGASQSYLPARTVAGSQSAGSNANVTQQILTVGKQLSANAYLSFERSLTGAQTIAKITYHLTRRLSLIGRAGADNAVDLFYTYSFK